MVDEQAGVVTVESVRAFKRGLLVRLEEVATREDADDVAGRYVLLPVDALPPLDEGELFYHQLLGLRVETVQGETVGVVREVYETLRKRRPVRKRRPPRPRLRARRRPRQSSSSIPPWPSG